MTDRLTNQVPEFDPVQESVTVAGLAALGVVPVFGGPLAAIVGGTLSAQAQKRNAQLWKLITSTVDELTIKVEGLTAESIAESPRFLATAEKVVRAARETVDEAHRARLIRALRHAGPWSEQEPYATERMIDLLTRLGPIHIFVLRFFADPVAWLSANAGESWSSGTESINGGSLLAIFGKYVFPNNEVPPGELARVVGELQQESLMSATRGSFLSTHMSGSGLVERRLTDFGDSFLAFAEGDLEP